MKLEAIKKTCERLRVGFGRFAPFNLVAIAVACVVVLSIHDVLSETTSFNLARGLYWGALVGVVCRLDGERRESRWRKIAAWPMTAIFGALGCWFWFSTVESSPHYLPWVMVYWGTFIALASVSVALLYRIADEKTLVSRLVLSAIGVWGSSMIFIGSIELCVLAFDKLVIGVPRKLYEDVFMFSWFTLVPVGFASLLPGKNSDNDGSDKAAAFLFWLLLPASLILLAILYIYLGRIVVTRTMPSGELNWFGSIALATYVFFWLALRDSTRTFFRRFVRWGWALLIPVLAAQIVGIAIRYNAYGLSDLRFAGMITLMIGIFALMLAAFNRSPRALFLFIAIVGLVATVSPLNIIDVPIRNQESRLVAALARNGISPDGEIKSSRPIFDGDAEIIAGAWDYLMDATPVYYHPADYRCIKKKLGTDSLFKRLGIDENALSQKSSYRRSGSRSRWSYVYVRIPGDGNIAIGDYNYVRPVANYMLSPHNRDGHYYVELPMGERGKVEEFDVTEHIARLQAASGWDGVMPEPGYRDYEISPAYAVWELRPGLAVAITQLTFSGNVGRTFSSVHPEGCVILIK